MFEGDLINEIAKVSDQMDKAIEEWEYRATEYANAEKDYQVELRKLALKERDSGIPVTFISQFIRGDEQVAELRRKRDIAEAFCKISENKVTNIRQRLKVTDAQAGREWSSVRDSNNSVPFDWPQ
jgi:hypothetical protein